MINDSDILMASVKAAVSIS